MTLLDASAVSEAELATLRRASADAGVDPDVRTGLLFALGEVLEARHTDEEAFAAFAAGNRLKYERLVAASNGPAGRRRIQRPSPATTPDRSSA